MADGDKSFLVYDNGSTDARLLVFASDTGLRLLGMAETWLCDIVNCFGAVE
ncbi:hypothetical protein DPMN_035192 [Dreissena polymorpha]|uniref:Uncharacterized protein n=1 Tax=Dreissena polymorpha TaxID=45954 RepID=A0A9D4MAG3_DREPO|nr:hypothetical protein DPMN_035192 [Dreissena polymorpha]